MDVVIPHQSRRTHSEAFKQSESPLFLF